MVGSERKDIISCGIQSQCVVRRAAAALLHTITSDDKGVGIVGPHVVVQKYLT